MDDEKYYRLSDVKTMEWLKHKVDILCEHLRSMPGVMTLVKARTLGYKSRDEEMISDMELVTLAIGFLSDFLGDSWVEELKNFYG